MPSSRNRIYFKGLNELRAFAAIAVIWHHIELYKNRDGISSLYQIYFRELISGLGLGKISYGHYFFHPVVMFLTFPFIHSMGPSNVILYCILDYSSVILITIFISHLSFRYFENYFIGLKDRFAIVKSASTYQNKA